jgi:hypothetical protein
LGHNGFAKAWLPGLAAAVLFLALGLAFVPQAGIQMDEALFASPIYNPFPEFRSVNLFGHKAEVMLLSYLGAVKTQIYKPIFRRWKPSAYSVRTPVIFLGAATIWLFWRLLLRISGVRAATAGAFLLATDTTFLLTTVFDWGPVVLQHLLTVLGMLLVRRFYSDRTLWALSAGFFCFGLALWDKALFVWIFSGLICATLIVFPREIWQALRPKTLLAASCAFLAGASPFLLYNFQRRSGNVSSYLAFSTEGFTQKWHALRSTIDGSALFGYITGEDGDGYPREPQTLLERGACRVSRLAGEPRRNWMLHAYMVALGLGLVFGRSRVRKLLWFAVIAMAVAWFEMALTRNAGGAAHHAILLWPLPAMLAAVVFAEVSQRFPGHWGHLALTAAIGVLCTVNLLVTNQHYAQLVRNGAAGVWTDAIFKLPPALKRMEAAQIYAVDWGLFDNLRLLSRGTLPMEVGGEPLKENPEPQDWEALRRQLSSPGAVFLEWVDGREPTPGMNARLLRMAAQVGYALVPVERIEDRNGRPAFLILRSRLASPEQASLRPSAPPHR